MTCFALPTILALPSASNAGSLLEDFGTDPTKISSPPLPKKPDAATSNVVKSESNIEPNLRSNYYYPTNEKRYLPRIKKCNDAIPYAAECIGKEDWDSVNEFVNKVADDTILPLKLYTSSLSGGGTNVKVSFTKVMSNAALDFEKSQKSLVKATKAQNREAASSALEQLASSLLAYRTAGRLL